MKKKFVLVFFFALVGLFYSLPEAFAIDCSSVGIQIAYTQVPDSFTRSQPLSFTVTGLTNAIKNVPDPAKLVKVKFYAANSFDICQDRTTPQTGLSQSSDPGIGTGTIPDYRFTLGSNPAAFDVVKSQGCYVDLLDLQGNILCNFDQSQRLQVPGQRLIDGPHANPASPIKGHTVSFTGTANYSGNVCVLYRGSSDKICREKCVSTDQNGSFIADWLLNDAGTVSFDFSRVGCLNYTDPDSLGSITLQVALTGNPEENKCGVLNSSCCADKAPPYCQAGQGKPTSTDPKYCYCKSVNSGGGQTSPIQTIDICQSYATNNNACAECVIGTILRKPGIWTALGCIPADPQEFVARLLQVAVGVAGGIAFLMICYGGFEIMISSGNPEKLNSGKEIVTSAIAGLLLIIFSVVILRIIGVDILKIPGLTG